MCWLRQYQVGGFCTGNSSDENIHGCLAEVHWPDAASVALFLTSRRIHQLEGKTQARRKIAVDMINENNELSGDYRASDEVDHRSGG